MRTSTRFACALFAMTAMLSTSLTRHAHAEPPPQARLWFQSVTQVTDDTVKEEKGFAEHVSLTDGPGPLLALARDFLSGKSTGNVYLAGDDRLHLLPRRFGSGWGLAAGLAF